MGSVERAIISAQIYITPFSRSRDEEQMGFFTQPYFCLHNTAEMQEETVSYEIRVAINIPQSSILSLSKKFSEAFNGPPISIYR
jgi:hypothetical protein